jgi:hypothetical protein
MIESIHGTLESNEGQRLPAEISLMEVMSCFQSLMEISP